MVKSSFTSTYEVDGTDKFRKRRKSPFLIQDLCATLPPMLLFALFPFLVLSALADKKAKNDEPLAQLISLAAQNNGVIKLNEDTFNILTAPSRNWSSTIQLTALNSFKCLPCK